MNSSETQVDRLGLEAELRQLLASGADQEMVLRRMRSEGLNVIASIKLLRDLTGLSLGDAKIAVHYSPVWADSRESNDALHEASFAAAKETGYSETSEAGTRR
jgi:hypothetical protein